MTFSERLPFIGLGSFLLFIGIAMLSPKFVKPLASVLGRPAERFGGAAGVLAKRNSERKPGRTAGTAAATDDRHRAGHLRRGARGGGQDHRRGRAPRPGRERRLRDLGPGQLVADHERGQGRGASRSPASRPSRASARTPPRSARTRSRSTASTPARIAEVVRLQWKNGSSDATLTELGRLGRDPAGRLREEAPLQGRLADHGDGAVGQEGRPEGRRPDGRQAERRSHSAR